VRLWIALVFAAPLAFAQQIVEGHVVDAATGTGVGRANVRLLRGGQVNYTNQTDPDGAFHFTGVRDGAYTVDFSAPAFAPFPAFGEKAPSIFVGAAGSPVQVEGRLQRLGRLSGVVRDGNGQPVPRASVYLVWNASSCKIPACIPYRSQVRTDEGGTYHHEVIMKGSVQISAVAPESWKPPEKDGDQQRGWAHTFFPGVADPELAQEIQSEPGREVNNLDFKLLAAPVHTVRGRIVDDRGDPLAKAAVALAQAVGPSLEDDADKDGSFALDSIADGDWRVVGSVIRDGVKLRGVVSVRVRGKDMEDVEVRLERPFAVTGKIVVDAPDAKPPTVRAALIPKSAVLSDSSLYLTAESDASGTFRFEQIYPGQYRFEVVRQTFTTPLYLDSAPDEVSLISGGAGLTVSYKSDGGTVRGTIEKCSGARVILIPSDPVLQHDEFERSATCDDSGHFEIGQVRPGAYYGFAVAWSQNSNLYDAAFLNQATRISVRPNEPVTAEIRLLR